MSCACTSYGGLFDTRASPSSGCCPATLGDPPLRQRRRSAGWASSTSVASGRLLSGPGTGLLAMVLLTLSPRYFGDAMNNPKDLPLAALMAAALYYLMRLEPGYPYLGWRLAVPLALAIGLAVNVRSGALVFLAYLAIALLGADDRDAPALLRAPRRHLRAVGGRRRRRPAAGDGVLAVGPGPAAHASAAGDDHGSPSSSGTFPVLFDGADVPATALPWTTSRSGCCSRRHPSCSWARCSPSCSSLRRRTAGLSGLAGARPVGRDALSRHATSC